MFFRFLLDSTEYPNPQGWEDCELEIKIIQDLPGIYAAEFGLDVSFFGDGYGYIRQQWVALECEIAVAIQRRILQTDAWATWITGIISVDETIFRFDSCEAQVRIHGTTMAQGITSNKNIKATISAGKSKNGEIITSPTNQNIDFFNTTNGNYTFSNVETYTVFETLEFLVAFMTDGAVTFSSAFFDTGGDGEGLCLTRGSALDDPGNTGHAPYISFAELYEDLRKLYNLGGYLSDPFGSPELVIEPLNTLRGTALSSLVMRDIGGLQAEIVPEMLYAKVKIGSSSTQGDDGGTFTFPDAVFFSHKEEEYHVSGACNVDTALDLVLTTLVIDSNVIEDSLENLNIEYDGAVFLVETDYPSADDATRYDTLDPGGSPPIPSLYNVGLTNQGRLANLDLWQGAVGNALIQYLGDGQNDFRASNTTGTNSVAGFITLQPVDFDDDSTAPNFDTGGNYDTVNYQYVVPAQGYYRLLFHIRIVPYDNGGSSSNFTTVTYRIRHYDSMGNLIQDRNDSTDITTSATIDFQPPGFYADSGDYFEAWLECVPTTAVAPIQSYTFSTASYWRSIIAFDGGGEFASFDPDRFQGLQYTFRHELSCDDLDDMLQAPYLPFRINRGSDSADDITCWIETVTVRPAKTMADFKVRTSRDGKGI